MTKIRRRIPSRVLRSFVEDYRSKAFPDWRLIGNDRLVREAGPVVQEIGFEALRSGEYRPVGGVGILVAPASGGLHRFLNIKDRSVLPEQHPQKLPAVVRAIRSEFVPAVDSPLDARDVLSLCARETPPLPNNAYLIAPLAAYLGELDLAEDWCRAFDSMIERDDVPEWLRRQKTFLNSLRLWIAEGKVSQVLDKVLTEERKRLGLK